MSKKNKGNKSRHEATQEQLAAHAAEPAAVLAPAVEEPVVTEPVTEPVVQKVEKPAPKEKRVSCRSRCQELIRQGLSNSEIWAIIQPEFNMPAGHKHYPGWYRGEMKRLAKTPEERAAVPASRPAPKAAPAVAPAAPAATVAAEEPVLA